MNPDRRGSGVLEPRTPVHPEGDKLGASRGAGSARVANALLHLENADQLARIGVQADAIQLLVAGVAAGIQ